jgi:hypothetical protein
MPIHSTFKAVMLRAGIVLAMYVGVTVWWLGQAKGLADEPTAAESNISSAFPKLRAGLYQDNFLIQVIEDPSEPPGPD